jgi:DNA polymerase-3 subunit beta
MTYPHPVDEIIDTVISALLANRSKVLSIYNTAHTDLAAARELEVLLGDVCNTLERDYKIVRVMKITVKVGDIVKALDTAVRLIENRNIIPILEHVLLSPGLNDLTVTSHNLDQSCQVKCPASGSMVEAMAVTVPGQRLRALLKAMPKEAEVTLTSSDNMVVITRAKSRYKVETLPVGDFPAPLAPEGGVRFHLDKAAVERLFGLPAFAVARDSARPYLSGIFLHAVENHLVAVSTDGHRLIRVQVPLPECEGDWPMNGKRPDTKRPTYVDEQGKPLEGSNLSGVYRATGETVTIPGDPGRPGVIIPPRMSAEIIKFGDDVTLQIDDRIIQASTPATTLASKLIDGTYLPYERVIPEHSGNGFTADRQAMAEIGTRLDAVAPVIKDVPPMAGFIWNGEDDTVTATLPRTPDTAEDFFFAQEKHGAGRFGMQLRYLKDLVQILPGERIIFDCRANAPAIRVTVDGDDDIIMVQMTLTWSQPRAEV